MLITRGDIWLVREVGGQGTCIKKTRPMVVVSNNGNNRGNSRVQVCPMSSQIHKVYPCEVVVWSVDRESKVMADQLITVPIEALIKLMGRLLAHEVEAVGDCIRFQLAL